MPEVVRRAKDVAVAVRCVADSCWGRSMVWAVEEAVVWGVVRKWRRSWRLGESIALRASEFRQSHVRIEGMQQGGVYIVPRSAQARPLPATAIWFTLTREGYRTKLSTSLVGERVYTRPSSVTAPLRPVWSPNPERNREAGTSQRMVASAPVER